MQKAIEEKYGLTADDGRLYDVLAVSLDAETKHKILWIEEKKTLRNAEAIILMAVGRQGVADRFFVKVPHGTYKEGAVYQG